MYQKQKAAARFAAATIELQDLLDKAAAGKEYDQRKYQICKQNSIT